MLHKICIDPDGNKYKSTHFCHFNNCDINTALPHLISIIMCQNIIIQNFRHQHLSSEVGPKVWDKCDRNLDEAEHES